MDGKARRWGLSWRAPDRGDFKRLQVLAIMPEGINRRPLQEVARQLEWTLTFADSPEAAAPERLGCVPPIVIFDRGLSPSRWTEVIGAWARQSPRPYVILLSSSTDANLWDELQRVGGSDILRSPIERDRAIWAVKRAWLVWRSQQHVRPAHRPK